MHQFILALYNPKVQGLVFVGVMQLKLRSGFFWGEGGFSVPRKPLSPQTKMPRDDALSSARKPSYAGQPRQPAAGLSLQLVPIKNEINGKSFFWFL